MPRNTILLFLAAILVAAASCAVQQSVQQPPPDVEQLKAAAMKGSLKDAETLSKLRDNPAILAMRDVLAKSDNLQVKIAMIQGLGIINKDIESVAMFLDIMEKDDDQVELRTKANEAAEICGIPGRFHSQEDGAFVRQLKVKDMREDYQKLKDLKAGPTMPGRTIPNARIIAREHQWPDFLICIPFVENGVRMRVSPSHPKTATSYHLEVETSSTKFKWDWKDLVMRIDVQSDGSMIVTAVSASTSPYSFILADGNGKVLVYDFGPDSQTRTCTFPGK